MSGDTTESSKNMSNKEIRPGSEKPRRTLSIRERLAMLTAASALGLTSLFPSATSAEGSRSAVQPRVERAGAPNLQVDEDAHSAISPDTIEKTPAPKPTATPVVTETPQVVAKANIPTPTPTPIATEVFTGTDSLRPPETITYTVATVLSNANIRSGPSTYFEVTGSAKAGDTFKVLEVSEDGKWLSIEFGDGNGVAFIFASLVSTALVVVDNSGPNQGGAVATPEASRKEQEVTLEQLAMLIDPVTFTGSDPLAFTDLVPKSEAEMRVNRALVQIALMHSGLNEKQLLEAMNNHERVVINLPAQRQDRQADRSPSWLGKPQPVLVDLQLGMNISFNKTEYEARQIAEQDVVIKSQSPDMSGANPTDLRLVCRDENGNETDEICGVYTTLGDSRSFNYLYVDEDGKLNLVVGEVDGYSRMTYPHHYFIAIAYSNLIEDEVDENGKATRYFLLFGFNETYQDGSPTLIGDTLVVLPKALERGQWYDTDEAYTEYVNMVIEYEHQ